VAENEGQPNAQTPVEAPQGFLSARVDEKGRLKLPAAIVQYLESFGERKVFITTLDGITVRLYPISVWRVSEGLLEEAGDDTDVREDVSFIAFHYGADDEIDGQGRVLVPTELRRDLKLESEQVFMRCFKQRIDILGREAYEERLARAKQGLVGKVQSLEKKGLR
jgi:MraZ protein